MKLKQLGEDQIEVTLHGGSHVLFSEETPVAIRTPDGTYYQTTDRYLKTTARHIKTWLGGQPAHYVTQATIDYIMSPEGLEAGAKAA